ncbi:MAG: acyl-CoA dehydrogenase family protein, partial [Pseudomonadota bacterium]
RMDLTFSQEELAFREEVRAFFANHYPEDIRTKMNRGIRLAKEDFVRWQKILHQHGYMAVNWPVEYGGTGWTPVQKYIFATEMAEANAPDVVPFGVNMVGPVIYTFGSEELKQRFLPDILESNVWWCQGYSEPGAGSDLASLKTLAVRDGDDYIINGTKTWTTLGQHADWIFVLARTNTDVARRQEGISFILCDMNTPGISVRPIITIEGGHEVNEVHFEDVRVPVANLVGEEGRGWTYGKVLLQHERTNIAGVARSKYRLARLKELARKAPDGGSALIDEPSFRAKLVRTEVDLKALEFTDLRTLAAISTGKAPGPESSILKIKGTEMQQQLDTLYMEAAGYYAMPFVPDQFSLDVSADDMVVDSTEPTTALRYFNYRKASIYGGSNEIQKNIIAKHVLGL